VLKNMPRKNGAGKRKLPNKNGVGKRKLPNKNGVGKKNRLGNKRKRPDLSSMQDCWILLSY
jgi:hypothetical protein